MTSKESVLALLRRGGRYTPHEIGRECHIQHNTAIKDIKFLRDDGHRIEKERHIAQDGTEFYRYYLTGDPVRWYQHETICACGKSYYSKDGRCNACGAEREVPEIA